jgi:hypothetical protein
MKTVFDIFVSPVSNLDVELLRFLPQFGHFDGLSIDGMMSHVFESIDPKTKDNGS